MGEKSFINLVEMGKQDEVLCTQNSFFPMMKSVRVLCLLE